MENKVRNSVFVILTIVLFVSTFFIHASAVDEKGEITIFNLELEKILSLINAWISLFLFVLAFSAYKRDGRNRLLFVSVAFLLFSIKSFLISSELFISEIPFLDPVAMILEFLVLLSFFYGVLKK